MGKTPIQKCLHLGKLHLELYDCGTECLDMILLFSKHFVGRANQRARCGLFVSQSYKLTRGVPLVRLELEDALGDLWMIADL